MTGHKSASINEAYCVYMRALNYNQPTKFLVALVHNDGSTIVV